MENKILITDIQENKITSFYNIRKSLPHNGEIKNDKEFSKEFNDAYIKTLQFGATKIKKL